MQKIILIMLLVGILFVLYWFYIKFDEDERKMNGHTKINNRKKRIVANELYKSNRNISDSDEKQSLSTTDGSLHSFDLSVISPKIKRDTRDIESFDSKNSRDSFEAPEKDESTIKIVTENESDNESEHSFIFTKEYSNNNMENDSDQDE